MTQVTNPVHQFDVLAEEAEQLLIHYTNRTETILLQLMRQLELRKTAEAGAVLSVFDLNFIEQKLSALIQHHHSVALQLDAFYRLQAKPLDTASWPAARQNQMQALIELVLEMLNHIHKQVLVYQEYLAMFTPNNDNPMPSVAHLYDTIARHLPCCAVNSIIN